MSEDQNNLGWIKLHRRLLNNPVFKNHKLLQPFLYCLLKASHGDREQLVGDSIVTIKSGQLATGRKAISAATGLTEQNIRTSLNKLEKLGIITINPTNKYSIISITNWDSYQQTNQQLTSSQPTTNQQTNHKQEVKNYKNVIELNTGGKGLPESENEFSEEKKEKRESRTILINQAFDFFWKAWPTKKNKDKAFKSFVKICRSKNDASIEELTNTLCSDIDKRLQANDFGFDRMHATTYLNNKRWEDDISAGDYQ